MSAWFLDSELLTCFSSIGYSILECVNNNKSTITLKHSSSMYSLYVFPHIGRIAIPESKF